MTIQIMNSSGFALPEGQNPVIEAIPEHIRQLISLMTSVIERISGKRLDLSNNECLYTDLNERRIDYGRKQYHSPVGATPDFI